MPFDAGADLITTAREGACRVLGAAAHAGVRRAVLTSSGVTAGIGGPDTPTVETTWAAPSGTPVHAYPDSKILAERDAWDLAAATGLELTAVLPTFMLGPMLGTANRAGTVEIIRRLLAREIPAVPNIGWNIVDVRDIAELHILAMTSPAAAGQRFLGSGTFLWYRQIARILREKLPNEAAKVPPCAPCPTSSSSCSRGATRRSRWCAPSSAARGSSTAAKHAPSSAGIPARPNRRSSTPPPRSSPHHDRG
jgi:nucleoside-diphosphate-sugar epimerase